MKRRVSLMISVLLVVGLSITVPANADETQSTDFNGIWVGSGKVSENMYCSGGKNPIPIYFIVQDGLAKSLIQHELANFEVKVNKKGKIKFRYKQVASEGNESIDIVFTGKLGISSGKGRFYFGSGEGCKGKWTVEKQ